MLPLFYHLCFLTRLFKAVLRDCGVSWVSSHIFLLVIHYENTPIQIY